jgi:hypothetical protein
MVLEIKYRYSSNTLGWAFLDGALNLLYLLIFCAILLLWRPTDNNQRYGLDQLAQDEDEYEEQLELGRMQAAGDAEKRRAHPADPEDIFDLDLNEGFESDEEEADDVLNWAEQTLASERRAEYNANKIL